MVLADELREPADEIKQEQKLTQIKVYLKAPVHYETFYRDSVLHHEYQPITAKLNVKHFSHSAISFLIRND